MSILNGFHKLVGLVNYCSLPNQLSMLLFVAFLPRCASQSDKVPPPLIQFSLQEKGEGYYTKTADYNLTFSDTGIQFSANNDSNFWQFEFETAHKTNPQKKEDQLVYEEQFPGTNLQFYDKGKGQAAYDFILEPGADPICLNINNLQSRKLIVDSLQLNPYINTAGELILPTNHGEIRHSAPYAYQEIEGEKIPVESHFVLEDGCLSFKTVAYEESYALVIDPTVSFVPDVPLTTMMLSSATYHEGCLLQPGEALVTYGSFSPTHNSVAFMQTLGEKYLPYLT